MRFFCADVTLYEMEQQLEHKFYNDNHKIRTIGDLNLSYEDYKYLNFKLKGILHYISKVEVVEQYKLCIVTTLVFAIRYEKNVTPTLKYYEQFMNQFQQHQFRFCIHVITDAFHEMGLSTYGIRINSSKELLELLAIHANPPKNLCEEIFEILEDYFAQKHCHMLEEELYGQLDRVFCGAYPFLGNLDTYFRLSRLMKKLYEACYVSHASLEQLYDDFDIMSMQVIEHCYRWFNAYSDTSNNLIKIR